MEQIIKKIQKEKIIVIIRNVQKDKLIKLCEALYDGGIRLVECTYEASGKISDEENAANIEILVNHFGNKMTVGAGTVLTERQVELTKKAGGKFVISPDTNPDIIKKTKELGLVSIPGAFTPTEICAASRFGADFVKVFPVGAIGCNYIKDVKAPLSNVKLLAVGGVDENNMQSFFDAGASGIGIGSAIINKRMIEDGDFEAITTLAKAYTSKL